MTSSMTTSVTKAMTCVVTCAGRLVAGDDADADITSRSRDTVHRHELVRSVSQQHHANRPVGRRDVPGAIR